MFRIMCILALGTLVAQSDCFEIKAFWSKLFEPSQTTPPPQEISTDKHLEAQEHGNLDFFGRDLIRKASKKYDEIKEGIKTLKRRFSPHTQGLDCNRTFSSGKENFKSKVQAIYPGTKWCGDGNVSKSYDDLGRFSSTDSCCREHDLCPDDMEAGATKYDLKNTGLFTRSHCNCDSEFHECLKKANSLVADSIGYTYFTILGPQCFKQDYPIVECVEEKRGKCEKYLTDQSGAKLYQWFDSPSF